MCSFLPQDFCSAHELDRLLLTYGERVEVGGGETLFRADTPAEAIYLIASGHVALVRAPVVWGGPDSRFQSVTPGGIVGDLDLVLGERRTFGGEATEATVVYRLSRAALARMEGEDPALAHALAKRQLRDMCVHIKDVSFRRLHT